MYRLLLISPLLQLCQTIVASKTVDNSNKLVVIVTGYHAQDNVFCTGTEDCEAKKLFPNESNPAYPQCKVHGPGDCAIARALLTSLEQHNFTSVLVGMLGTPDVAEGLEMIKNEADRLVQPFQKQYWIGISLEALWELFFHYHKYFGSDYGGFIYRLDQKWLMFEEGRQWIRSGLGAASLPIVPDRTKPIRDVAKELCRIAGPEPIHIILNGFSDFMANEWNLDVPDLNRKLNESFSKELAKCHVENGSQPVLHTVVEVYSLSWNDHWWLDSFTKYFNNKLLGDERVQAFITLSTTDEAPLADVALRILSETGLRKPGKFFINGYGATRRSTDYRLGGHMFSEVSFVESSPEAGLVLAIVESLLYVDFDFQLHDDVFGDRLAIMTTPELLTPEMEEVVRRSIMASYQKHSRPHSPIFDLNDGMLGRLRGQSFRACWTEYHNAATSKQLKHQVPVLLSYDLTGLKEVDVKTGSLSTFFYQYLEWNDTRLMYSERVFQGELYWEHKEDLWLPSWHVDNLESSFDKSVVKSDGRGHVTWREQAKMTTSCSMNAHLFPFDWHNCSVDFVLMQPSSEVVFVLGDISGNNASEGSAWSLELSPTLTCYFQNEVREIKGSEECPDIGAMGVRIVFHLKRDSVQFWTTHIWPSILLTVLCICTLFLNDLGTRMGTVTVTSLSILQLRTTEVVMESMTWLDTFLLTSLAFNFTAAFITCAVFVYGTSARLMRCLNYMTSSAATQGIELHALSAPVDSSVNRSDEPARSLSIDTQQHAISRSWRRNLDAFVADGSVHFLDLIGRALLPIAYAIFLAVQLYKRGI
jgi:hypothetical protein